MSRVSSPHTMFQLPLSVTPWRHISFLSWQRQFDNVHAVLIRGGKVNGKVCLVKEATRIFKVGSERNVIPEETRSGLYVAILAA